MSIMRPKMMPEMPRPSSKPKDLGSAYGIARRNRKMAKGGMVKPMEMEDEPMSSMEQDEEPTDMADAIMRRREMKKMAEGGIVEDNYMEAPADAGRRFNEQALKKELYDEQEIQDVTYGSDMDGPSPSEERMEEPSEEGMDHIEKIRMRMKKRPLSSM